MAPNDQIITLYPDASGKFVEADTRYPYQPAIVGWATTEAERIEIAILTQVANDATEAAKGAHGK